MPAVKRKSKKANRPDRRGRLLAMLGLLLLPWTVVEAQSFTVGACRLAATPPRPSGVGFSLRALPVNAALLRPLWPDAERRPALRSVMLPHWSAAQLPFFCRIEHQWAKGHRVPVKFRLGSVEYVDWLEGKRGAAWHSAR